MRVLVTGGCGFIGSNLVKYLISSTKSVIFNLDKLSEVSDKHHIDQFVDTLSNEAEKRYKFIDYDLTISEGLRELINDIKPDIIMNLAAETHVDKSIKIPRLFVESNVIGTYNLLEAAYIYWQNLPIDKKCVFKFHQISTDEVFGELGIEGFFDEKSSYNPRSPYSASKAAADHFVQSFFKTYDFPTIITYSSNNYGPWQSPDKFIPLVIDKALSGHEIPIYGDGSNIRNWLFVDDHVKALWAVVNKGKIGSSYCIGSKDEVDNLSLTKLILNKLSNLLNKFDDFSSLIKFVEDRQGHDFRYSLNSHKINREIRWISKFNLSKGLDITINWYISNRNWVQYMKEKI